MVAQNAQTYRNAKTCQSADHRRLLSAFVSFFISQSKWENI